MPIPSNALRQPLRWRSANDEIATRPASS